MGFFYIKIGGISMPAGKKGFQKGQASFSNRARRTNKQIADDLKKALKMQQILLWKKRLIRL